MRQPTVLPAAARSQSVEPTALYETSAPKSSRDKDRYVSDDMNADDPFAAPASLAVGSTSAAAEKKAHGRHTVQVEYDSRASKKDRADRDREQRERDQRQQQEEEELRRQQREKERAERERERAEREREKERAQRERESLREQRVEPPLSPSKSERRRESESSHKPLPTTPGVTSNGATPQRDRSQRTPQTSPKKHGVPPPVTTPQRSEPPSINVASPPDTPVQFASPAGTDSEAADGTPRGTQRSGGSVGSAASKGHKKGMSVDRLMRDVTGTGSTEDSNASASQITPAAGGSSYASQPPHHA
ncbi:hypothetical protein MPER_05121 [Moniliophthora perniciosa FA553]|nr:hypothetical protein MPER_05121 [Moniliophthora perniciosa FA553]